MIGQQEIIHIPEWVTTLLGITIGLGAITIALGYVLGQFRSGSSRAMQEALLGAQAELSVSSQARERLETEVREYRDQVQRLTGKVDQLEAENGKLTKLVMGEQVPPAMQHAMEAVAVQSVEQLRAVIDELLHPVAQGIARLLAEGREQA